MFKRWILLGHGSLLTSAALALSSPALAQLDGVWSSTLTAAAEPDWLLDDFFCFAACTKEGRLAGERLLASPESAHRSTLELYPQAVAANVRSVERLAAAAAAAPRWTPERLPGFQCDRPGFASQVVSPLPLEIETEEDRVTLRYEEFGAERAISLDPTRPRGDGLAFGTSKGRFEHGVLVVETTGIRAGRLSEWLGGFAHSDALQATERYSVSIDGRSLLLLLTLEDPATLAGPLVVTKRWLRAAHSRIVSYRCDFMSAGLGGVFAEYLDPRVIDARRPVFQGTGER
jgi:hypothetical protein